MAKRQVDFYGIRAKAETRMRTTSCLWCRFGQLQCSHTPIYLTCTNPDSPNHGRRTKRPTMHKCKEWRYKF